MRRESFKLLIVEDNTDDVLLLLRELKRAGYEVEHHVVCGEADLRRALTQRQWDCVTSDHKMPQFTGHDAVRVVREVAPDLPLVIVSGEPDPNVAVNLLRCGADDFVHKDELHRVVDAIQCALRKAELSRARERECKRLREKQRIYRSYFDLPVVGAAVLKPDLEVLEANSYLASMLGAEPADLQGQRFLDLIGGDTDRIARLFADLGRDTSANIEAETSVVRRDGVQVPAHLSAHFYEKTDDAPEFVLCVVVPRGK